ncbi:uncharacterized protein LOC119560270 [Drosophila subpulchrella]|uniref:uncharacterized protein LOC119560270 n=1 Tax=Drosophila subpulchrella TaxID=1486046 RepID=UPI0018A1AEE8|nr:uncharacterized protein LOC119560270 [Drosophila subpulchrella]
MDLFRRNPLLEVAKCEMCPKPVYHFVTGLCARCLTIWAGRKQQDPMRITVDQSRALLVGMVREPEDLSQMDPVFRRVIEETRMQRTQKVELFQKVRQQFQLTVLTTPFYDPCPKYVVNEDYWNVPEIEDMDVVMFQNQIDLLSDIPLQSHDDHDQNNNGCPPKKKFKDA